MPFTIEQFLEVFKRYNLEVWPIQIAFYLLAILVIFLAIRKQPYQGYGIAFILAFFWIWMGVVYHWIFFSPINKMAWIFGSLFVAQGLIFAFQRKLTFHFNANINGISGAVLMAYALIIYPMLGMFFGHVYPYSPTFGLPCPTTIFTFGLLLWTVSRMSYYLLIVPFLWSLIGLSVALQLGILEDTGLIVASLLTVWLVVRRNRILARAAK